MQTSGGNRRASVVALVAATALLAPAAGFGGYAAGRELRGEPAPAALPSAPATATPTVHPTASATPSPSATGTPTELSREARELATQAAVRLSRPSSSWYLGSGSVVSPDGLVLTNAHVAQPTAPGLARLYGVTSQDALDPEQIVVSTTTGDGPAEPTYLADVLAVDGHLDLAVLKISSHADGTPLPADLELPHVPIGSVDDLSRGDDLTVYGYPSLNSGGLLTVRTGVVGSFLPDPLGLVPGDRVRVETSADFSPGNSGGMALANDGRLVGVPSSIRTEDDSGAQGHDLHAVDLAAPLLEAARTGTTYRSPFVPAGTGEEVAELIGWTGQEECASVNGERVGGDLLDDTQTSAAGRVWLGGFAPGEDVLGVLNGMDRGPTQVLATAYDPADPCLTVPVPVDDSGYLVPDSYLLEVFAGPDREQVLQSSLLVEDVTG
jgi:S1-C subfamily serine protease